MRHRPRSWAPALALAGNARLAPLLATPTAPVGDARDGQALLIRLKAGFPTYRDAFALLPERAVEGARLMKALPGQVRANELEAASAALARLDAIVAEAARHADTHEARDASPAGTPRAGATHAASDSLEPGTPTDPTDPTAPVTDFGYEALGVPRTRPADADLLDRLERLRTETEAIDWPAIGQLKSMRRDAFAGFQAEGRNPLLRAWEYTLTALAERASSDRAMQKLQHMEMEVVEDEAHDLAARIVKAGRFRGTGVGTRGMRDIVQRLMASYRELFAAGTSVGYDAATRTGASKDGHSTLGVWCLYDIQGIDDPDQWIKIEDAQAYGRLVQGMMMLAWKQAFGQERDPAIAAMSRRLADELSERLLEQEVADRMNRRSEEAHPGRAFKPWRLDGGGVPGNANEVLDGRPPVTGLIDTPANGIELVGRLGTYLKTLWNDPTTNLKADADRHGDMATVSVSCFSTHGFSLVPGTPAFARLLDDPRDFQTALDEHVAREREKWKQARAGTWLRTRDDVAEQAIRLLGDDTPDAIVDEIWTAIRARPTMEAFCDQVIEFYTSTFKDRLPVVQAALARHVVMHLAPPVAAAELGDRLGRVAKALAVPADLASSVVHAARATLNRIDRTQACMTDIRAAMAASMRDHGLDDAEATQQRVTHALRQPAGLVFADTNWGDAAHRVKFSLVVHPFTGEPEVWEMNDDNSHARPADQDMYVRKPWQVMT